MRMGREKKIDKSINKEENTKKKKKLNALDIIVLSVIAILLIMYAPRAWSLYEERREMLAEAKKPPVIEYPLEVEITEQDTEFFVKYFKDYSVGITAEGINLIDDISQNDMVDFCRAILSKKYSSSGLISKSSMDSSIKKYFDVEGISYSDLGYKELNVYTNTESKKLFNVTKLMQTEKDSDIYLVYADCIDKSKVQEESYKKEDIEDIYIFTFKKIVTETTEENIVKTDVKYILQKVEKEVIEEEIDKSEEKNDVNKKEQKNRKE